MGDTLTDFIATNPDARELKRTIAVQMFLKGYKHRGPGESPSVSSGFISKWTDLNKQSSVLRLKLDYHSSSEYLKAEQGLTLSNLGEALTKLGRYDEALTSLQAELEMIRAQGAKAPEASTYKYLGMLY